MRCCAIAAREFLKTALQPQVSPVAISGYHIGAAAGDYDNDGDTDLFLANAGSNTLLRNNRDGTFTDATADSGISKPRNTLSVGAAWFDYDNDRLLDLVVSDYTIWTPETDVPMRRFIEAGNLLQPHPLRQRSQSAVSQSRKRQIRRRHRTIGACRGARQRDGRVDCRRQR